MARGRVPAEPLGLAFDTVIKEAGDIANLVNNPQLGETARYAVPTTDHYSPILHPAALRIACELFQNRAVPMRGFRVGEG